MLLKCGGFQLRKWAPNPPLSIESSPDSLDASSLTYSFNQDSFQRILGLEWNRKIDSLRLKVAGKNNCKY